MIAETALPGKTGHSRNILLDAAQQLFISQGYAATSMRQIAENSGLALGSIYNHFPSKEAIFQTLLRERQPCQSFRQTVVSGNFDRVLAQTMLTELMQDPDFFNLVLIEIVEFRGKHLPETLAKPLSGVSPPAAGSAFISMVVSYHITRLLLAESQQVSADAFIDHFLKLE